MSDPFASETDTAPAASGGMGHFFALIPVILRERKWWVIVPTVIGIIAALAAVVLIPPTYRANAVMLVQSAQIPKEILALDGTEVVDRRIARIKQQVTARPDLIEMIERHNLYNDERDSKSLSEVVEGMREAITLTPNQVGDKRSDDDTIAFDLAFEYSEPVPTQAVTQELMEKILALDSSGNVEQATNTVQFLEDQATGLATQIAEIQGRIAQVTAANGGVLAGGGGVISSGTASYDMQIAALQRENQQLVLQRSVALSSSDRDPVVVAAEQQLAQARAIYAENHPDVKVARQRLAEARELAKANVSRLPTEAIDQQLAYNNAQINALRGARAQEDAMVRGRADAQARAPLVQQQIAELQRQATALNQSYEDVQTKLMNARAGVRAEDEQMGERLVVVEPPVIPSEPIWPDRLLLLAGGILGGLGLGVVLAFAIEFLLQPIRDPHALGVAGGGEVLGAVPVIEIKSEAARPGRKWWWPFGGGGFRLRRSD